MEDVKCLSCKEDRKRKFEKMIGKNYIFVDEHNKRWKNSQICPTCFKLYDKLKAREKRAKLR